MVAPRVVIAAQAPEVDNALQTGVAGHGGHGGCRFPVGGGEVALGRVHGVDEVVGGAAAVGGAAHGREVADVGLGDFEVGVAGEGTAGELVQRSGHGMHAMSGGMQGGHKASADIAGGAGDEDGLVVHGRS